MKLTYEGGTLDLEQLDATGEIVLLATNLDASFRVRLVLGVSEALKLSNGIAKLLTGFDRDELRAAMDNAKNNAMNAGMPLCAVCGERHWWSGNEPCTRRQ